MVLASHGCVRRIGSYGFRRQRREKRGAKMRSTRLHRFGPRIFAFLGVMALALSVTAAASADTTKKHIVLIHDVLVGDTKLPAGDYQLVMADGLLTVKRDKQIIVQAPARWELRDETPYCDSVLYEDGYHVSEIRFAHHREVLVIVAPTERTAGLR